MIVQSERSRRKLEGGSVLQNSSILLLFSFFPLQRPSKEPSTYTYLLKAAELCRIAYHVSVIKFERAAISVNFSVRFEHLSNFYRHFKNCDASTFWRINFALNFLFPSRDIDQKFRNPRLSLPQPRPAVKTFLFPFPPSSVSFVR